MFSLFASPDINIWGLGEFETVMQTQHKVEYLHNCQEFSKLLECFYQVMQTQGKKVSHYFYKTTFPRKKQNSLFMALMKREILTSQEVLYTKFCMHNQCLFCKKDAF